MPYANDSPGREDPLLGFNFALDLSGAIQGYFTEVSGIGSENEVIDHKVVTKKGVEVIQRIPGRLKWGDIVLKRGITSNMDLWDWRKQVEDGKVTDARKNGSIVMFDQSSKEVARWNFVNAWPSKISGPAPKADSNEIGIEELTIVHEHIERAKK
jgi:phage tail-like protein